jgi:hypothetical protein
MVDMRNSDVGSTNVRTSLLARDHEMLYTDWCSKSTHFFFRNSYFCTLRNNNMAALKILFCFRFDDDSEWKS